MIAGVSEAEFQRLIISVFIFLLNLRQNVLFYMLLHVAVKLQFSWFITIYTNNLSINSRT